MIEVTIYKNNNGSIEGYNVTGHAEYDVYGKDIVCAAVSVLAQTILISLVEVCNVEEEKINYNIDDKKGIVNVKIPQDIALNIANDMEIVLKTFEVGIKSIVENYSEYVTLKYKEV